MANIKGWKDITSYSQGDKDRTPRTFEMAAGKMRLLVTRHRDLEPTEWKMEMQGCFGYTMRGNKTAEFAMHNCMMLARDFLRTALDEVTQGLDAAIAKGVDNMQADPKAQPPKKSE